MAVRIGSARKDERNKYRGGVAGDQTGEEVSIQFYYVHTSGWYVIRPNLEEIAQKIADDMQAACDNPHIGYDQGQNTSLASIAQYVNYDCSKVTTDCETDCARLVRVCVLYAGIKVGDFYTGNMKDVLLSTGKFTLLTSPEYCQSDKLLKRGDILVTRTKGHTVVVLDNGEGVSDKDYAISDISSDEQDTLMRIASLYEVEVTRADALLREVGYINNFNQPSIQESQLRLSVINYTNLLGNLFSMYTPVNVSSIQSTVTTCINLITDTSAKACMLEFLNKGLNAAASCGIVACIEHMSDFDTGWASGTAGSNSAYGICRWTGYRANTMKMTVFPSWETNLTGQVRYLWNELELQYQSLLKLLQSVPNTSEGAKKAADLFTREFDKPTNLDKVSTERQQIANGYWTKIAIQQTS